MLFNYSCMPFLPISCQSFNPLEVFLTPDKLSSQEDLYMSQLTWTLTFCQVGLSLSPLATATHLG